MKTLYIWQQQEWPNFKWDSKSISYYLGKVRNLQGQLLMKIERLGFKMQNSTVLDTLTADITKSSEIEGVIIDMNGVRSSIARHLGIETEGIKGRDRYIEGVVQIVMDATHNCNKQLTVTRLFNWHAALFPTGRSGAMKITVANWRKGDEPMQVVSGAMGKEKVHFQAPDSKEVASQMRLFLKWINKEEKIDPFLKSAIAHLWFVTVHPFDDGNGRLARTIADMMLARADNMPHRFYSMSAEILKERKEYYDILEKTQKGSLDITSWLAWFLKCLENAIKTTEKAIGTTIKKSEFWEKHRSTPMNVRQVKIVNMLWDGFYGNLTTSKWAKIAKCSQDTALRDIEDLISKKILKKSAASGRSTSYEFVI